MVELEPIGDSRARLGESPAWDAERQTLFWIDSINRTVFARHIASGREQCWSTPNEIGSIALTQEGNIVLALEDGFYFLNLDDGAIRRIAEVRHPKPSMRLNDGKADRQGRFLAGSVVMGRTDPDSAIYRLDSAGSVVTIQDNIAITNGICFSPDGTQLYYSDTAAYAIYAVDYEPVTGMAGSRRRIVDTRPLKARPDGATVDADGFLWVALVDSGQLGRFAPDGSLDQLLDLGVPYVTCPAFGGEGMDTLFLTSLSHTHTTHVDHPLAGRLFALNIPGVRGIEETRVVYST